jgi:hypothetical protein
MGFELVSFLPTDYQVKLGLIVQVMRFLYLRVWNGRNIVWLCLLPEHAHEWIAFPHIPVILADH